MIQLEPYQVDAVERLHNGCVLVGGTGSGKTISSLVYVYEKLLGGETPVYPGHGFSKPKYKIPVYVITTPKKRDSLDWQKEASNIPMEIECVQSWNNISKFETIKDSIFIFDETRVIGYGSWTKSFLKITKNNKWILLSATPADNFMEYMPLFLANGFYKNKTEFEREHVIWSRFAKYPKVDRYINVAKLIRNRDAILVKMHFQRETRQRHQYVYCDYDKLLWEHVFKERWDVYKDQPIRDISQLFFALRRIVNSDKTRCEALSDISKQFSKIIIFYNFDYELEILRQWCTENDLIYAEWNGHKHEPIPRSTRWIYLCQYTAASDAWNCTETNCMVFYSQTYSYKASVQAVGRIDRMNTPFKELYYFHLTSASPIDKGITLALKNKKNFNEGNWLKLWSRDLAEKTYPIMRG